MSAVAPAEASARFARHVLQRTVVLPDLRVLFVPVPKAGCTSLLWSLADLAGIPAEDFSRSAMPEVSPALTVHDMNLWRAENRLGEYGEAERERMLSEDGWLRFSVVRHPAPRLWSAWQSKLLLREPRFVEAFGDRHWFPRVPERPADLIEDFRRFVAALPGGDAEDVHWAVQHELVSQIPLTHVGRVERLEETVALLRAHVGEEAWAGRPGRENRSPLPLPTGAYDDESAAVLRERYAADFRELGYDEAIPAGDAGWEARVEALLPALQGTIEEHTRIGQLSGLAQHRQQRVRKVEERLEAVSSRKAGRANSPVLMNLEGHEEFAVRWAWIDGEVAPGFTAVLRVKNEARSLPWVLPSLLRAVDRVVLIDNGSTDGTPRVALRAAEEMGAGDRLDVHSYPFAIARCGEEHLGTPTDSIHSLAYFYNWSFAHVRTAYALKWDGDMVLTATGEAALRDLAWQLEGAEAVVKMPRYPFYVLDDRHGFVDVGLRNTEPWAWPNAPGHTFVKAMEWELPLWRSDIPTLTLPDWACAEIKYLDADEFGHWSDTDFEAPRQQRKRREWAVFNALAEGGDPPEGVVPVVAPDGVHVVDHVRDVWLPARARGG